MDRVVALSRDRRETGREAALRSVDAKRTGGRLVDAGQALIRADRRGMIGPDMLAMSEMSGKLLGSFRPIPARYYAPRAADHRQARKTVGKQAGVEDDQDSGDQPKKGSERSSLLRLLTLTT